MSAIRGVIHDGKVVFDTPPAWPEGTPVEVEPVRERIGISEEEQGDDPESIARWLAWFDSVEPVQMKPEEEAAMNEWRSKMKTFNVEAVRRQMEEGLP